ncbi:MAG: glycosyl transferase family 2 [Odoribacter sp.]|nr:glycosyl transferase family 2 [Odoribacter sp.]
MECTFIIQARMGSTRFPGKILIPFFEGQSILELLIYKLLQVPQTSIILATSDSVQDDLVAKVAENIGVEVYRGSETDVLDRFIKAAEFYSVRNIIRICSDNPFLDLSSILELIKVASENKADYISFDIQGRPSIKTHYGFWAEFVTLEALRKVAANTAEKIYHEHVTNFIYEHASLFQIHWIKGPVLLQGINNIRLTIDTETDFENARKIYAEMRKRTVNPSISEVVNYIKCHPEYSDIMETQIKLNSK